MTREGFPEEEIFELCHGGKGHREGHCGQTEEKMQGPEAGRRAMCLRK